MPAPDPHAVDDEALRLAELAERAARNDLADDDRLELDRLLASVPGAAEVVRRAREEVAVMQDAANAVVEGFDFERARRAISERDRLYRRAVTMMVVMVVMVGLSGFFWVVAAQQTGWAILAWSVGLPLAPVAVWALWRRQTLARERRLLIAEGDAVMPEIFAASRRSLLNEFELLRVSVVVVCAGLLVLVIDALFGGAYARAAVGAICLVVLLATAVPRVMGRRAREQARRFADGEITAEEFSRGGSRKRP